MKGQFLPSNSAFATKFGGMLCCLGSSTPGIRDKIIVGIQFQAFMYFCFGLPGFSGMDILSLPVSGRGVDIFS